MWKFLFLFKCDFDEDKRPKRLVLRERGRRVIHHAVKSYERNVDPFISSKLCNADVNDEFCDCHKTVNIYIVQK